MLEKWGGLLWPRLSRLWPKLPRLRSKLLQILDNSSIPIFSVTYHKAISKVNIFGFGIEKKGLTVLYVNQAIEKILFFEFLLDLDRWEINGFITEAEGSPVDDYQLSGI